MSTDKIWNIGKFLPRRVKKTERGAFFRFLPCAARHGEMKYGTSEVTQDWAEGEKNYGCGLFMFTLKSRKMIAWSWKSKFEGSHWDLRGAMSHDPYLLNSKLYEKSIWNWDSDSQLCQWDTGLSDITLICRPGYVFIISPWTSLIDPKLHAFLFMAKQSLAQYKCII